MTLLTEIKQELLKTITSDPNKSNLIRKHDKNISKTGDFSFPSLHNSKVWGCLEPSEILERIKRLESVKVDRVEVDRAGSCLLYLHRSSLLRSFFGRTEPQVVRVGSSVRNLEEGEARDLTAARVHFIADILGMVWNIDHCSIYNYLEIGKGIIENLRCLLLKKTLIRLSVSSSSILGKCLEKVGTDRPLQFLVRSKQTPLDLPRTDSVTEIKVLQVRESFYLSLVIKKFWDV